MWRSILLLAVGAWTQPLPAAVYSVSPGGDDAAVGSLAAPWKTLAHAASVAQAGDTVELRQGVYRQSFSTQRSGTAGAPIVFKGRSGENAVLCGSELVTGAWTLNGGKVWRIDGLPATWDVYVDGQQMIEARWPNRALGSSMDTGRATADTGTDTNTLVDAALPATDLTGAKVRIAAGSAWVNYSRVVTNYGGGRFNFDSSVGPNASYYPKAGNSYILYRHLALLDSAGEWYQDPGTHRLYLWLPQGDAPGAHQIEIASRKVLVTVSAHSYIQLRDLFTFSGALSFSSSSNSKVVGVHQKYVHTNEDVDGYNYPPTPNQFNGGSNGEWSGGSIVGSHGDGLFLAGTGHHVFNMDIHDICRVGTYRGAVRCNGTGHIIEDNTFYDSGRFLVYHGGTKGGAIRRNHLYNAGLLTKDLGATYCFQTDGGGMEIAYNHIHDVHCEVGAGIYLDNASSRFNVHHNLVHDIDWFALKLNLPSYDNIVVNNTLFATKYWVNAAGSQFAQEMTGTALVNNLYGGGGTAKLITGSLGPTLLNNATYATPPAVFNVGAWSLATGSPAIDKGTVYSPYATVYCGAKPDQGCFESACGPAWTAGDPLTPPPFPYPFTNSSTPTYTSSATRSATPSATRTVTSSATKTATPSATRTATSSVTRTVTATSTATGSITPGSSATLSSTSTASPTATSSVTLSSSPTPTSSATSSATGSVTPSSSATGSATLTPSPSCTSTSSVTATATSSATLSVTPSSTVTPSGTPTWTPTVSPSATVSVPPTSTRSVTPTLTASATATAQATRTATPSPSSTVSPIFSASATPTPTFSATSTATLTAPAQGSPTPAGPGPLNILACVAFPNPNPSHLAVHLEGPADAVVLRVYSVAGTCEAVLRSGPWPRGWSQVPLPAEWLAQAPNGLFFVQAVAEQGGRRSQPGPRAKLLRLR